MGKLRVPGPLRRIVAMGDVHGCLELMTEALSATGLLEDGTWAGGDAVLIQTGDLIDRGPSGLSCMDLMMTLEAAAPPQGGRVVSVLGNHELMALACSDGADSDARSLWMRNGAMAVYGEWATRQGPSAPSTPPEAFYDLFGPGGVYGRWIMTRPAAAIVDDLLVTHAGMDGDLTAGRLCRYIEEVLDGLPGTAGQLVDPFDPVLGQAGPLWTRDVNPGAVYRRAGPLWTRDLSPEGARAVCRREGVAMQVVGHTPSFGLSGPVLNVDAGMVYTGTWQVAVREGGSWSTYSRGGVSPLSPI